MLHQSNASQDARNDDLRHEKSSSNIATYVAATTATMAEERTNDVVAPSIEDVTDDEVERNDIPMDVNIGMEASRNLQLVEKHMTKELKDDYFNDDPVIDIAKLFDPTKRKKLRKEIEEPLILFDPLHPTSEEALESFRK
ncbi:hypothetical protein CK203_024454 [Vitis vinifera]|uniref:Uncharacterized protein n=1 Tax=Vitis vinifera TaxID=29760 RepID=A0A438IYG3_VITVI|nr:hypothetical protein CK203_024454 [Vitis vinifera]